MTKFKTAPRMAQFFNSTVKSDMFSKRQILSYLAYAIPAAIVYCIVAGIFLYNDTYNLSYLLYIGNVLFGIVILFYLLNYNKKRDKNSKAKYMVASGHITAVIGILISCVVIFILMAVIHPNAYEAVSPTSKALARPAAGLKGDTHPLIYVLFMDAVFGNIGISSFLSFMLPFTAKSDQTAETASIKTSES
jgi:hypothetical protein